MQRILRVQVAFLHPHIFMLTVPASSALRPWSPCLMKLKESGTLLLGREKDSKPVKIKKNKDHVKFKVQCSRNLYTLVIPDKEKAAT